MEGSGMIVETIQKAETICHFDDGAYADKSPEEVKRIIQTFSAFILECLQKKKTA